MYCFDVDRDCFTIIQKTVSNGQFLFIGTFENNQNTSDEDPTIGFANLNLEVVKTFITLTRLATGTVFNRGVLNLFYFSLNKNFSQTSI